MARSCFILLLFSFILSVYSTEHDINIFHFPGDLYSAIENVADYIEFATNEDGSFKYQTVGDNAEPYTPATYNSVRHAGTIWSMTLYIKYKWVTEKDLVPEHRAAVVRAVDYLKKLITSPTDENGVTHTDKKGLLVSEETENDDKKKYPEFGLGGMALSLLALASVKEQNLAEIDLELLQSLGRFVLYMMNDEGDFPYHYFYQNKGLNNTRTCEYYPGESALSLYKLYTVDKDLTWLTASKKALEFLAKKHLNEELTMVDHWFLIGSQHMFLLQDIISFDRQLLIDAAVKFAYFAINYPRKNWCNTNAIMEGFTAICLLFKYEFGLGHVYEGYENILSVINPFLIVGTKRMMICQGKNGGLASDIDDVGTDKYRVRIDYNQHTMSGWIRTYEYLYSTDYVPQF